MSDALGTGLNSCLSHTVIIISLCVVMFPHLSNKIYGELTNNIFFISRFRGFFHNSIIFVINIGQSVEFNTGKEND